MLAQLAHQPQHLIVGSMCGFKVQNDGFDGGLGEQRKHLFPDPSRVVWKADANTSWAASCTDSSVVTTAMRGAAPVGIVIHRDRHYRSIFHPWQGNF